MRDLAIEVGIRVLLFGVFVCITCSYGDKNSICISCVHQSPLLNWGKYVQNQDIRQRIYFEEQVKKSLICNLAELTCPNLLCITN
uniref:Uncharacterized protein n=1 Tax=Sphaerodactylus townsendi TaxID=933632 RepID=A0ACB8FA23_9SAUR